jgi:Flp pilus assembly protein TadB
MAIPLDSMSGADRVLKRLERERREEADARATVWAFLWILFGFKIVTIGIIWYVAAGSGESLSMIAITTWYWLIIPVAAIVGPLAYRWRMIRMRRRREQLREAEWNTGESIHVIRVPPGWDGPDA